MGLFNKTFIWGHRGSGFTGIQNTLSSFKNAVDVGVDGLKTEAKLSKDGAILLTFDDKLKKDGIYQPISNLDLEDIKEVRLKNGEGIPTLHELFDEFKSYKIKYNFDIMSTEVGIRIVQVAKEYNLLNSIEISKPSIYTGSLYSFFYDIRKYNEEVVFSNSVCLEYSKITSDCLELGAMKRLGIGIVNINYNYVNHNIFRLVKDLGFKCYIWGVLFKRYMKKFLEFKYNDNHVDAIFTNQPARLIKLRNKIQN